MSFLWLGGDLPFWRWPQVTHISKEGQAWTFLAGASSFYSWTKLLYKIRYMKTKTLTWLVSKAPVVAVWIFVNSRGELVRRDHVRMSKPGLGVRWPILGSWGVGRWSTPKKDPTFRSTFFLFKSEVSSTFEVIEFTKETRRFVSMYEWNSQLDRSVIRLIINQVLYCMYSPYMVYNYPLPLPKKDCKFRTRC